jgi:prepilin-type N-terminal cleavage/methylation domain-containing protein
VRARKKFAWLIPRYPKAGEGASRGAPPSGFTILELLVATVVFSVVLLVVTAGILQIARVYYKGVTESTTQNTARAIIDTISQAIQFSGGNVTATPSPAAAGTNYAFCVGNQQFSYVLGWQVENGVNAAKNQGWHALVQRTAAGCSTSTPAQDVRGTETVSGRDLVGEHMRLSNLVVEPAGPNQWRVTVRVVYGDNDLLNDPPGPSGPTSSDAGCRGERAGSQFCSVSELSTVVIKRVD